MSRLNALVEWAAGVVGIALLVAAIVAIVTHDDRDGDGEDSTT